MSAMHTHTPAPILVATDLAAWGDLAIQEADRWARELGLPLRVLHCISPTTRLLQPWMEPGAAPQTALDEHAREARATLDARVTLLTGRDATESVREVVSGTPHVEIIRAAESCGAALVVVGARGGPDLSREQVGRSARKVARYAHCPVLVARPGHRTNAVLVATDLSRSSVGALQAARAVSARRQGRLTALHVIDSGLPFPVDLGPTPLDAPASARIREQAREALRAHLAEAGVDADALVADGLVVPALRQAVRELRADLVIVGTIGRTGLARILLGSTAEAAIRELSCSVLVVRPPVPA